MVNIPYYGNRAQEPLDLYPPEVRTDRLWAAIERAQDFIRKEQALQFPSKSVIQAWRNVIDMASDTIMVRANNG